MTIQSQSQNLSIPYALVELFVLDCSNISGPVFRFTPNVGTGSGGAVMWQGNAYTPLPIMTAGWEYASDGSQKKPTLTVANVNKVVLPHVISLGDLVGAKLTRFRTFENYLDGAINADPTQHFPVDQFIVEQKTSHDNEAITWQLCSVIDRMGMQIPRRQVTKDGDSRYCTFPGVGAFRPTRY